MRDNLLHGPCGPDRPSCACMQNGSCRFHYPKEYQSATVLMEGQWVYRRQSPTTGGVTTDVKGRVVTNADVVPHNPYLTKRHGGHTNVEACASMKSLSYIFKYIYKGADMVIMSLRKDLSARCPGNSGKVAAMIEKAKVSEVCRHQVARWINATEAAYISSGGTIQKMYPSALRMTICLENRQLVSVRWAGTAGSATTRSKAVQRDRSHRTMLTEFFAMNESGTASTSSTRNRDARILANTLRHPDFPGHFAWDASKKIWRLRARRSPELKNDPAGRKSTTVGRIDAIVTTNPELRCLRLLLLHVCGPTSYANLREWPVGTTNDTFQQAAIARGLLHDHGVICRGLDEVYAAVGSNQQFIAAFAQALQFCEPVNPVQLLETYLRKLAEGPLHQLRTHLALDPAKPPSSTHLDWAASKAISLLFGELRAAGGQQSGELLLGIPMTQLDLDSLQACDHVMAAVVSSTERGEDGAMLSDGAKLSMLADVALGEASLRTNAEQWNAYSTALHAAKSAMQRGPDALPDNVNRAVFLYASGGAGKTFTLNLLLKHVRALGGCAVACASTGIAGGLLDRGRTFHSTMRPSDPTLWDSFLNATKSSEVGRRLLSAHVIVIDEATMLHNHLLHALDRTMRLFRERDEPFGGCAVVLAGDWRQCLPVTEGASPAQVINSCITSSPLWRGFAVAKMSKNMRLLRDPTLSAEARARRLQYHADILAIGDGVSPINSDGKVCVPAKSVSLQDLIQSVYGNLSIGHPGGSYWLDRCILTPLNKDVTELNCTMLGQMPGDERTYFSDDNHLPAATDRDRLHGTEYLNQLAPSGIPAHELRLKLGAPVMLLRNINLERDQCNGSRYLVREMRDNSIKLEHIATGAIMWCFRVALTPQDRRSTPIQFKRVQFPIRLCMAMTINKSQGQSFGRVGIYLPSPVFAHGQLCVALSRSSDPDNVFVCFPNAAEGDQRSTFNTVLQPVLAAADPNTIGLDPGQPTSPSEGGDADADADLMAFAPTSSDTDADPDLMAFAPTSPSSDADADPDLMAFAPTSPGSDADADPDLIAFH